LVLAIVISGGDVRATGTEAAGIGAGYAREGLSAVGTIVINGSTIGEAISITNGAGIGAGYGFHGNSVVGNITLSGSVQFEAIAELDAAGIGAANGWFGQSLVGNIVIDGGRYRAFGNRAAGIGAGYDSVGNSSVARIVIRNGNVLASGIVGLGSDPYGQVGRLEIDGREDHEVELDCRGSSNFCLNASTIIATNAWLIAHTNTTTFIDPRSHTATTFDSLYLSGFYSVPSKKDSFGQARLIHFGKISGLVAGTNSILLRRDGSNYLRQSAFNGSHIVGVVLSVEAGTYKAFLVQPNIGETQLCINSSRKEDFTIENGESFYAEVGPCGTAPDAQTSGGLSAGAKAGISVGVIVVVAAITGVVFWRFIKPRCRGADNVESAQTYTEAAL
jgi:hypothetical protein